MKLVCQKFGVSPHALTQPVGRRRRQRRRSVRLSAVIAFPGYKHSCCDPDRSRASLLFRRNRPPLANNSAGLLASLCPPFFSPPSTPLAVGGWRGKTWVGSLGWRPRGEFPRAEGLGCEPAEPAFLPRSRAGTCPNIRPCNLRRLPRSCAWGSAPGGSFCRAFGGVRAGDEKQKTKIPPAPCICWAEPPFSCGGGCGASLGAGKACPGASLPPSRNARSLY